MYGTLKKKFGQNFLIDKNILIKIVKLIPKKNLDIIEIGPGDGRLTELILNSEPKKLKLIEIDNDLIELLNQKFKSEKNIEIINEDVMNYNLNKSIDLIMSNLPYNISSQILVKICLINNPPPKLILMFQKEFAIRLLDKKLNSLNSLVKCFYDIKSEFYVSKNCFRPIPKVDSGVLVFSKKRKNLLEKFEIEKFILFKRKIFSHKRKQLNSLLKKFNLTNQQLDLSVRVEDISLNQLIEIFRKANF